MIVYEILDLIAIILTTISITILIFTSGRNKVLPYFITCQIFLDIWTICHLLEIHCQNILQQIIINDIGYFAVCFIGVTFFLFTLYYTNSELTKNRLLKFVIYIPSIILYFFMITNPIFNLYFEKYQYHNHKGGIGFYMTIAVTYLFILTGIGLLLYKNIKTYKTRKLQAVMIILATIIPIVVNFLSVVINFQNNYDLTPVSFSVSSILIILAIYRYDFMDVNQNGIKQVIDKLNQHIIIFNEKNTVTYVNKSFGKVFKIKITPDTTNINNLQKILIMFSEHKFKQNISNLLINKFDGKLECYFLINKKNCFIILKNQQCMITKRK
ncbi:MAG: histidine kinase N-terminal 7TM domain-containing protein [Acutalibacteraceae bacterium]|nr:histidine kinase N-terminal 7TM domain-containing protein [Acutalibacteraceae bacterium]